MYPAIDSMVKLSVAELLAHFEDYLDQVEAGAFYLIVEDGRPSCVLMPYAAYAQAVTVLPK